MAIRVGDPIVRMRAAAPDPCGVLAPPIQLSLALAAGGILPAQTLYVVQTWLTPWGETSGSVEQPIDVTPGNQTLVASSVMVPGAVKTRIYIGYQPQQQSQYQEVDLSNTLVGAPITITIDGTATQPSIPPQLNRAYLPDSDGSMISSSLAFSWLNQALRQMVINLGGIPDISGVAWPTGAAWQALNNRWTEITNLWWSGWWTVVGKQAGTWMQNPVQSVPGYSTSWSSAGQDIIGLWPQPGSGPPSTTLAVAMTPTDLSFTTLAGGLTAFKSPGLVQVENEMMLVSGTDPTASIYSGIVRGIGGTFPAAHPIGSPVVQLIVMFTGNRLPPEFQPGSAYSGLQLPSGWDVPLDMYLTAKFREKEQDAQGAQGKMQEFNAMVEQLRSARDPVPKGWSPGDARVYAAFAGYKSWMPFGVLWN